MLFKLAGRPETEMFLNPHNQLVIKQGGCERCADEQFVYFDLDQIDKVIERMERLKAEMEEHQAEMDEMEPEHETEAVE